MVRQLTTVIALPQGLLCWYIVQLCTSATVPACAFPLWTDTEGTGFDDSLNNDTTSGTVPTTTAVTPTTVPGTTPKMTTAPNTIGTGPTVPPPSQLYFWNTECVSLAVFNITFNYKRTGQPIVTDIPTLNVKYGVAGPRVKSICAATVNRVTMEVYWESSRPNTTDNFNFTLKFRQEAGQWEATEFFHKDSGLTPYLYSDQSYFQSPLATAFSCGNRVTRSVDNSASVEFSNIKVQAFTFGGGFSDSVNTCPENLTRDTERNVGLIVGASVGSIVVVGLLAIVIGKSAHREYELLK